MPNARLTESRIGAPAARSAPYDVRDTDLKGFGLRVLPSGARRFFVHSQHEGRRVWKTVGDAQTTTVSGARALATEMLGTILRGGEGPHRPGRHSSKPSPRSCSSAMRGSGKPERSK